MIIPNFPQFHKITLCCTFATVLRDKAVSHEWWQIDNLSARNVKTTSYNFNYNMSINEIVSQGNVQLVLSASDLKELLLGLMAEVSQKNEDQEEKEDVELSSDEVAKRLGVTKTTLWRWQKTGYLIPSKVGRKCFYHLSQIEKLMKKEN